MVPVPLPNTISSCGYWSSCVNALGPDARETQSEAPVHTTGAWKPPGLLNKFLLHELYLARETLSGCAVQPWVPAPLAPLPAFRCSLLPHTREAAILFAQEAGQQVLVKLLALRGLHLTLNLHLRNAPSDTVLLSPCACCTWGMQSAGLTETGVW